MACALSNSIMAGKYFFNVSISILKIINVFFSLTAFTLVFNVPLSGRYRNLSLYRVYVQDVKNNAELTGERANYYSLTITFYFISTA